MIKHIVLPLIFSQAIIFQLNAMEDKSKPAKRNSIIKMDQKFSEHTKDSRHFKDILLDEKSDLFRILSTDKSKAAVIRSFDEHNVRADLMVVDLIKDEIIHKGTLDHRLFYKDFALSSSGDIIVAVYKHERNPYTSDGLLSYYPYILAIQKVGNKQKQEHYLSRLAEPLRVAFNKKGTKVIVHGTNYTKNKPVEECLKYSLNSESDQLALVEKKSLV